MALTSLQVVNVCSPWNPKDGSGVVCRYLQNSSVVTSKGNHKWVSLCTKFAPAEYAKLVAQRAKYNQKESEFGDNCGGFLFLKHKEQGYDKP